MCVSLGNQSPSVSSGTGQESRESTLERRKSELNPDKRGGTPEPNRRRDTRSNSVSSVTSRYVYNVHVHVHVYTCGNYIVYNIVRERLRFGGGGSIGRVGWGVEGL